ncbi:DUF4340 domain-containing protein [Haliangium sp.]|uniref:DUF4340 domain-containing protein n=1 Tax=Haliangium sp. TaxID=2663208 RepID=UPI003D101EF4
MASARALWALGAVAALVAVVALWDLVRAPDSAAPALPRLVPACAAGAAGGDGSEAGSGEERQGRAGFERGVRELVWERPGQAPVSLTRDPSGGHRVQLGEAGVGVGGWPADPAAVRDLFATLELLRPRRRLPADRAARGLDEPRLRLHLRCRSGGGVSLGFGDRLAAMDRVWVARVGASPPPRGLDDDYLIAGYAARALDRSLDDLRARRVFAALDAAAAGLPAGARLDIRVGGEHLRLSGRPLVVHLDQLAPGAEVAADSARAGTLIERIGALRIARFIAEDGAAAESAIDPGPDEPALTIELSGVGGRSHTLSAGGPCPGEPALGRVRSSLGDGCVDTAALAAVAEGAGEPMVSRRLVGDMGRLAEIHVAPAGGPAFSLLARGSTWRMRIGAAAPGAESAPGPGPGTSPAPGRPDPTPDVPEVATEPSAVREWLAHLDGAASGAYVPAGGTATPALVLTLVPAGTGSTRPSRVALYRGSGVGLGGTARWRARRGREPIDLVLERAPHAGALMPVTPLRFRDRGLLALEPTALRAVRVRAGGRVLVHLVRGVLIDDWQVRVPPGARVRAGVIAELRELARLRARRFVATGPAPAHGLTPPRRRVELDFDPEPLAGADAPTRHVLELGAATDAGCLARLDGDGPVFELATDTCAVLIGPWRLE